jgi:hypothetical protein
VISRTASAIGAVTAVCLAERGIRVVIGTFPVPAVVLDDRRSMASAKRAGSGAGVQSGRSGESTTNPSVIAATTRGPLLPLFVVDRGLRASHDRFGDQCTAV